MPRIVCIVGNSYLVICMYVRLVSVVHALPVCLPANGDQHSQLQWKAYSQAK